MLFQQFHPQSKTIDALNGGYELVLNGGYELTLMSVNHTNTFLRENATEKGKYLSLCFTYEGSGHCRGKRYQYTTYVRVLLLTFTFFLNFILIILIKERRVMYINIFFIWCEYVNSYCVSACYIAGTAKSSIYVKLYHLFFKVWTSACQAVENSRDMF